MNLKHIRLLILFYRVVRFVYISYFYDMFYETKNFNDFKKYAYPGLPVEEIGKTRDAHEEITIFENEIYSVSHRNIEVYRNNSWHDKVGEFFL